MYLHTYVIYVWRQRESKRERERAGDGTNAVKKINNGRI